MERAYRRRHHSTTAQTAWQLQFQEQRRLFRRKAEDYWRSTIAECHYDSRQFRSKLGLLLRNSEHQRPTHTAADLVSHFVAKVDRVRDHTTDADPPLVVCRPTEKLSDFQPVTVEDIRKSDQGAVQTLSTGPDSDVATETCRRSPCSSAGCHVQHVTDDWEASVC